MNLSDFIAGCERTSNFTNEVNIHNLISDLKIINESQKVTVPKFIDDWIFKAQLVDRRSIRSALEKATIRLYAKNSDEVIAWLKDISNQDTFARAWLDGYTVEEEKRYYVRLKGVDENYNYLNCIKHLNEWVLTEIKTDKKFRSTHTRKELEEAGFGWVFDCPGVEIEEVKG
jgi:hypothetical protein